MRLAALVVIGVAGLAGASLPVQAAPVGVAPVGVASTATTTNLLPVAEGCGRGFHWVGRYRGRYGHWHPGHCQRN